MYINLSAGKHVPQAGVDYRKMWLSFISGLRNK